MFSLKEKYAEPGVVAVPLVSVCMTTYNHSRYIRQAIDSVLMQETDFPVEVLLYDDCSTDGTTEIVREYAARYPGLIRPVIQAENQYSQGRHGLPILFKLIRGSFVAVLEGDDAWSDPSKLSIQVQFLFDHPEYSICYSNTTTIDDDGNILERNRLVPKHCNDLGEDELVACVTCIPTATVMYRNYPLLQNLPREINQVLNGDSFLYALLAQYGKAGYVPFMPSLYRQHVGGIYSSLDQRARRLGRIHTLGKLYACVRREHRPIVAKSLSDTYISHINTLREEKARPAAWRQIMAFLAFSLRHRRFFAFISDCRACLYQIRRLHLS